MTGRDPDSREHAGLGARGPDPQCGCVAYPPEVLVVLVQI
jgi:hypothetical protein